MNLRILKKLSKRCEQIMIDLGYSENMFKAERNENYTTTQGHDRKHWERSRIKYKHNFYKRDIYLNIPNSDEFIKLSEQYINPWKNTPMVSFEVGYYDRDWEEETTWDAFKSYVLENYYSYEDYSTGKEIKIKLKTPSQLFKAFYEIEP